MSIVSALMRSLILLATATAISPAVAASSGRLALGRQADVAAVEGEIERDFPALRAVYEDIHEHPELAFHEVRTAALLAARMRSIGFTVTEQVGKTGIVAVYRNGAGPVVMVRTEMDALPLEEKTGLAYASRVGKGGADGTTFIAHACGHDMHMAWWLGAARALVATKGQWHGTLVFVGQPAEETVSGARAMLEDGLYTRFPKPDFAFGAHVSPELAGTIKVKQGVLTAASDSLAVRFLGVGAHGSMPDKAIDPVVMGARFVMDVQSVISRQKDPLKFGVVTVGAFQAGTVGNIIPDHADLLLSLRSFDADTRGLLTRGVESTAAAVAMMSHAPAPEVRHMAGTASVVNDEALAARLAETFRPAFPDGTVQFVPMTQPGGPASEDFSEFISAGVPHSVMLTVGGTDAATIARAKAAGQSVPVNHSPYFAPAPEPTIRAGAKALALAVLTVAGLQSGH